MRRGLVRVSGLWFLAKVDRSGQRRARLKIDVLDPGIELSRDRRERRALGLLVANAAHDDIDELLVARHACFERLGLVLNLIQIGRVAHMLVQAIGRMAGIERIEHAAQLVCIDAGRRAKRGQLGDVVGEHFGRGELGGAVAPDAGRHGKRGVRALDARATQIDQAKVEAAVCNLLGKRSTCRANDDIAQRDVAVRKRRVELLCTQENFSQAFSNGGDGVRGNAAALGRVG